MLKALRFISLFGPARGPALSVAIIVWLGALAASPLLGQAGTGTIRVSTTGSNFASCGSAASPCATPNYAKNRAQPGDVIKVAAGTYTDTVADCQGAPAILCMVNDHATIQGGFSGGDWTNPDPENTPTIFDGQNSARIVRIQDGSDDLQNDASLTLDGVTLTRGFLQGAASGSDTETTAFGGCIDAINAPLFFTDVVISNCRALGGGTSGSDHGGTGAGGGVALRGFPSETLTSIFERVRFDSNVAEGGSRADGGTVRGGYAQGGAIFLFRADLQGIDLTFVDNIARAGDAPSASGTAGSGSRADAQGAGLNVNVGSEATLTGVVATGNQSLGGDASTSGGFGGGAFGPALYSEQGTLTATDFDVRNNLALGGSAGSGGLGAGGGVMATASTVALHRGLLIENLSKGGDGSTNSGAAGGGGGYFTGGSNFAFTNLIVADNAAELGDLGSAVGGGGGAFFLQASTGTMDHLTMASNQIASTFQGEALVLLSGADASLAYSIVSDHSGTGNGRALHVQSADSLELDTGLFANNAQNTNEGEAGAGTFTGLMTMSTVGDIQYVAPGSPSFDYHLQPSSPAVDAATGSTETLDVDGDSRTDPDIGADEINASIFSDGFESGNTSAWSATI